MVQEGIGKEELFKVILEKQEILCEAGFLRFNASRNEKGCSEYTI